MVSCWLATGWSGLAIAQGPLGDSLAGYRLRDSWTGRDGLPQDSVTCLAQTADDFLWIGTHGGLARFDGRDVHVFNTANTPELGSNRILSLSCTEDGTLWIGTEGGGCCRYRDGGFLPPIGGTIPASVLAILEVPGEAVWLAGTGISVVVDGIARVVMPWAPEPLQREVSGLALGPAGGILAAAGRLWRVVGHRPEAMELGAAPTYWATTFVAGSPDLGVFGRCSSGFFRLRGDGSLSHLADDGQLQGKRIFGSLHDRRGRDLLATEVGLFQVVCAEGAIAFSPVLPAHRPPGNVRAVYEDHDGGLWVGLDPGGLQHFVPRDVLELRVAGDGIPAGWQSVGGDHTDGLWMLSGDDPALYHWAPGTGCQPVLGAMAADMPGSKCLAVTRDGDPWIRIEGALVRYREGRFVRWEQPNLGKVPAGSELFADEQDRLWCGSPGLLHCFDGTKFEAHPWAAGDCPSSTALVFADDGHGTLWFSDGERIARFGSESPATWSRRDGGPREQIRDLVWRHGGLWICTYGGGLYRFQDGRFHNITSAHGLFDDFVSHIEVDDRGSVWLNSNRGVFRVSETSLLDVAAGRRSSLTCSAMRTAEGNGNTGCCTRAGLLVFPTIEGLVIVDRARVPERTRVPVATLLEVTVAGRRLDPRRAAVVPPGRRDVRVQFTAPTLLDPENVRFAYRLVGIDETWQEAGLYRSVHYPSLPPGTFRFEVATLDEAGGRNPRGASFELELQPHFHETSWFLGGCILLAVASLVGAYEWRHLQARRRRAGLEQALAYRTEMEDTVRGLAGRLITIQDQERARISRDLHDDLNQRLTLLTVELELCTRRHAGSAAVPLAEELRRLSASVQDIASVVHRVAYELHPSTLDQMGLFAALRRLGENSSAAGFLVTWRESGARPLPSSVNLNVFRLAQEALQNAIRHSGAVAADLELAVRADRLQLCLADAGRGFDVERQPHGLGILSMRERVRLLGGRIVIESRPGHGTRVVVDVPLPAAEAPRE